MKKPPQNHGSSSTTPGPTPDLTHSIRSTVKSDIAAKAQNILLSDPTLTPIQAMERATAELLANNPFVAPPSGACLINKIPPELLAHIFRLGMTMEEEEEDEEFWKDDEMESMDDADGDPSSVDFPMADISGTKSLGHGEPDTNAMGEDDDANWTDEEDGSSSKSSDTTSESDEDSDFDSESDEEPTLPFQVLVSHVCRHWRDVALSEASLWSKINFFVPLSFEKYAAYISRTRGQPIDVTIDCTFPDGSSEYDHTQDVAQLLFEVAEDPSPAEAEEHVSTTPDRNSNTRSSSSEPQSISREDLVKILDFVIPYVARWRAFAVSVSAYSYMYIVLQHLAACGPAPCLELLQLHHYDEWEDNEDFTPPDLATRFVPFSGTGSDTAGHNCPRLEYVTLWGVHLDWAGCRGLLSGLHTLELTYHAMNVRPLYRVFRDIISSSPQLHTLNLCLSGPTRKQQLIMLEDQPPDTQGETNEDLRWGDPIEIATLKELVLCYHDPDYAVALVQHLYLPNLNKLTLDYEDQDYTTLGHALAQPVRNSGHTCSLLSGLEYLKIAGFPCNDDAARIMLEQLSRLRNLNLNCMENEERVFFNKLMLQREDAEGMLYCPSLHTLSTRGIRGADMVSLVAKRRSAGCPLKQVRMCTADFVIVREVGWLKQNLDLFEFYEPSDSEDEDSLDDSEGE